MNKNNLKSLLLKFNVINNNYLDLYLDLIINKKSDVDNQKTQKHHIIPKSFYKMHNMKIDNSKDNIINLSIKDHILAHYYLANCTEGRLRSNNVYAVICLTRTSNFNDAEKLILTDKISFKLLTIEHNEDVSKMHKHKVMSLESTLKLSNTLKTRGSHAGVNNGMYGKIGRDCPTKGKVWINDGHVNKMVGSNELNKYLDMGYQKGQYKTRNK